MEESDKAVFWLEKLERTLDEVRCHVDQKATCAVSLLQGVAYDWWKLVLRNPLLLDLVTWDYFITEFNTKHVTDDYKELKWKQFLTLRQGKLTVAEYEKEFNCLNKYAPNLFVRKNSDVDSLRRAYMSPSKGTSQLLLRYKLSIFIS